MEPIAFSTQEEAEAYAVEQQWASTAYVNRIFDPCTVAQRTNRAELCKACPSLDSTLNCTAKTIPGHSWFMPELTFDARKACPLGKWDNVSDLPDYGALPIERIDPEEPLPAELLTADYLDYLEFQGMEGVCGHTIDEWRQLLPSGG